MSGHVIAGVPPGTDRASLLAALRRLALFTVVYNVAEGTVAIAAAVAAGSRALAGFGLDSGVESISGAVLLWRLRAERTDADRAEAVEHRALRLIGVSFLLLAAYVAVDAIGALARRDEPDASVPGIVLTVASLVVMPVLARRKRRVAIALGSRAAEADSVQTTACVYLSAVVLAGLAANAAFGWWWADPVAALGVVGFLVQEGREALTAEQVDDCC